MQQLEVVLAVIGVSPNVGKGEIFGTLWEEDNAILDNINNAYIL